MKTLKPMIKDAELNKYMLKVVKARDPGHDPQGSRELLFKFWDPELHNFSMD